MICILFPALLMNGDMFSFFLHKCSVGNILQFDMIDSLFLAVFHNTEEGTRMYGQQSGSLSQMAAYDCMTEI